MTDEKITKIGIVGAGTWGSALAQAISRNTDDVSILTRNQEQADEINNQHTNSRYLQDIPLNENIKATTDAQAIAANSDALFLVTPAQHMRAAVEAMQPVLPTGTPLIICSKGIEMATGMLMSQVVDELAPENTYLVLSGPNFADEIAKGLPAATTLATSNSAVGKRVAQAIFSKTFRPYVTSDPIGAEIGGAIKNVIAIACGIVYGSDLGENARAAIMTRGMAEIKRMGKILGARPETFLGLSGLGDLTLTCNSMKSRNFSLGVARGRGESLNEILAKRYNVTEGVATSSAVLDFAKKHAIDMPICAAVNETLHKGVTVKDTIDALMSRPLTQETL
jgi:glycerol-3-phosphate dehydrogenase (NAD(P)+)